MFDDLKIVVQTTNTLKISDQNLICTVLNYVVVTPVTTNTQIVSKNYSWPISEKINF